MNIRSLTMRWLTFMLLLVAGVQHAKAQYVYKIKADTVRIYNTCDTAELVLQNRTQNTLGYLYNKGGGVTEFRALNAVDLIYKSNDTLYYHLSTGQIGYVKIGLSAAEQSSSFILNQNATAQAVAYAWISGYFKANTGYQSIRTTAAAGTGDYSILDLASGSNRWGIGRIGQESGSNSGTDFVIKGYSDNGTEIGNYLKLTRVNKDAIFGGHIKIGDSTVATAATYFDYRSLNGIPVTSSYGVGFTTGTSGGAGMTSVSGAGPSRSLIVPFNGVAPVFTSNGGASWDTVWHAGNHAKGNQFSQAFTNGTVLSTLTTNASGHVTGLGVRTLTPGDIGAVTKSVIRLDSVLVGGNYGYSNITLDAWGDSTKSYEFVARRKYINQYTARFSVSGNPSLNKEGGSIVTNNIVTGQPATTFTVPANDSTVYYSKDGNNTMIPMWHAQNHPAGSAFNPALTGATVLSQLTTNAAGHITAMTTRTLTPSDIGAAASSLPLATVLTNGNRANNNIILGDTSSTNNYVYYVSRKMNTGGYTQFMSMGLDSTGQIGMRRGTVGNASASDKLLYLPYGGTTVLYSPDNGTNRYALWHSGNDGAGSGLDADLLDGKDATGFIQNQAVVPQATANAWVSGSISATTLYTSAPPGTPQHLFYTGTNQQITTASRRWLFTFANADGANTGSDFALQRCDNTGGVSGTPLFLQRSNGYVGIK